MRVWRICKQRWSASAFDGDGARQIGGRWNHKGDAVVYASSSLSLAALELFVNLDPLELPDDLVSIHLNIPSSIIPHQLTGSELPPNWREYPAPANINEIGSQWIRSNESLLLIVPSAVVPQETNVLINPMHEDLHKCNIGYPEPFEYDPRMWKQ